MTACAECMRAAVIRSEALGYAERRFTSTVQASELLRLPPAQMNQQLRLACPGIDADIDRHVDDLLARRGGRADLWAVCRHDGLFPHGLHGLDDMPHVVFGAGEIERFGEFAAGDGVAIVGARRASSYGRDVAYSLGSELSAVGICVVSGLALGIDGAAHRGAIQAGGRTIAVLAGGPDLPYPPSHRRLYEQITGVGSVVSENPPGTRAKRWAFPARNRIIAALSRMTILVEGAEGSGARYTAEFAEQLDLEIGAVPGPVTSPLSHIPNELLTHENVRLIRGAADVFDVLSDYGEYPQLPGFDESRLNDEQIEVLECIASGDSTPRAIGLRLPMLDARKITRELGALELMGEIKPEPDGSYSMARKSPDAR
jgi:DNA processing protein